MRTVSEPFSDVGCCDCVFGDRVASAARPTQWSRGAEATVFHLSRCGYMSASTLMAMFLVSVSAVRAEVRISGSADAIQIDANNGSVDEIFATLRAQYPLQVRGAELPAARISGIYRGSLRDVVSRLLEGCNYIIERKRGGLSVIIVGLNGAKPTVPGERNPTFYLPNATASGASPK